MITEGFKKLLSSLCELNHHQRHLAKAALDRQTDQPEVLGLVKTRLSPLCGHAVVALRLR